MSTAILTDVASTFVYAVIGMALMVIVIEALRIRQGLRFKLFALYFCVLALNEVLFDSIGVRYYYPHVVCGCVIITLSSILLTEIPAVRIRTMPLYFWGLLAMGIVLVFTGAVYIQRLAAGVEPLMLPLATANVFVCALLNGIFIHRRFGEESYGYLTILVFWLFHNFGFADPDMFVNRVFAFFFFGSLTLAIARRSIRQHRSLVQQNAMHVKARDIVSQMLHEMSTTVKDLSSIDETLRCVLETTTQTVRADGAAVFLMDLRVGTEPYLTFAKAVGNFWPVHESSDVVFTKRKYAEHALEESAFRLGEGIVGTVAKYRTHAVLDLAFHETEMARLGINTRAIKKIMAVPFLIKDQVLGVLVVQNKQDDAPFNANDLHLIQALADQAAVSINSFRIYAQLAETEKMRQEMQIAARIQAQLLPATVPAVKNLGISAFMRPAKEVGGDYYDFIPYDGDHLGIVIGDVSGKGLPAGMIMIIANAIIKIVAGKTFDTKRIMTDFSREMFCKVRPGSFMTVNYLVWDGAERILRYTGAGHEHIIWYHGATKTIDCIKAGGVAVGLIEQVDGYIAQKEIRTQPGDMIVLYTDGVTEALHYTGERYTLKRLVESVKNNASRVEHQQVHKGLLDDLFAFMGDYEQYDDITLIVMQVM